MKYIYLATFLVASILLSGCATKEVKPVIEKAKTAHLDLSKIHYPTEIKSYKLQNKYYIKNEAKGIMIRYLDSNQTTSYLDCNIYPKANESNLTSHYQDILMGISFMNKQGLLKKANILKEESIMIDANHPAQRTIFEMENEITPYYSVLYLAPLEDHYFYVRFSNPHKAAFLQSDFGEKIVKELFSKIKFNK